MKNNSTTIKELFPAVAVDEIILPVNKSLNDIWLKEGEEGILNLFQPSNRNTDGNATSKKKDGSGTLKTAKDLISNAEQEKQTIGTLKRVADQKLVYLGKLGEYAIYGHLPADWKKLAVRITFTDKEGNRYSKELDLYQDELVTAWVEEVGEKKINPNSFKAELDLLVVELEAYRVNLSEHEQQTIQLKPRQIIITPTERKKAELLLKDEKLLFKIDELIERAGIVGEKDIRLIAFIAASTALNGSKDKLHVVLQGSTGTGKSEVLNVIAGCIPSENVTDSTRFTPANLFNTTDEDLTDKLLVLQDYAGLNKQAEYALRELMSNFSITTQGVIQDKNKKNVTYTKTVKGNFASLSASTKAIYADNESRSLLLPMSEDLGQTKKIVEIQNKDAAGLIDHEAKKYAQEQLQNMLRILQPCKVINPFATKVHVPLEARHVRRLNKQFQIFVKQITWLHQVKREKDEQGRLISTKQDVIEGIENFITAFIMKTDDMNSPLRQFFEQLVEYMDSKADGKIKTKEPFTYAGTYFKISELARYFKSMGQSTIARHVAKLEEMEFIQKVEGEKSNKKHGLLYQIYNSDKRENDRYEQKKKLVSQFLNGLENL
jgi:hypothetical protein